VIGGDLNHDDPDTVGVLDAHLGQPPGLGHGPPDDRYSGRGQPGMLLADVPHLDPDHHRAPGSAGRLPGDLKQSLAKEENHARMVVRRAELPVHGQAQDVTIEAQAAVQVAGALPLRAIWP